MRRSKTIMIQGSSSGVGKSLITMAIARHFRNMGLTVAPFKAQNMSLNSAISCEGGEISRAQFLQAVAAGIEPSVRMNPVLIKPTGSDAELIVLGKHYGTISSSYYMNSKKEKIWGIVCDSLHGLMEENDLVVIEGAGSPAEINLKQTDIANMRVAKSADAPVILVADIDRGGAFAQIAGTIDQDKRDRKDGGNLG